MSMLHGVHVKHNKNTAAMPPVRMPVPKSVVIPMSMHIGAPAQVAVAVGEHVKVGQLIATPGGFVSSPIYSGVSGTVKRIDSFTMTNGGTVPAVTIECDGKQEVADSVKAPSVSTREEFLEAVKNSGVVGLGGAGFPTMVKLNADPAKIEYVIVNGAECEPYITSDTRTMIDDADKVVRGLELLHKYLGASKAVIGIEKNKPQCIKAIAEAVGDRDYIKVMPLPSLYPQGGEKVLAYHTVGRVIEEGKLPIDAGVIIVNCTTLASIVRYVETGMPLVEKCVTVDGSAVNEPKNVIAPIGTPVADVFEFCGGFKEEPKKVLYGGPMMGIALTDLSAPILKQTNAVLAFGESEARLPKTTDCIRCGRCAAACPFSLMPVAIEKAYNAGNGEALESLKVNLCMECGCCSYVCPARKQLVHQNKLAKDMLRNYQKARSEGGAK